MKDLQREIDFLQQKMIELSDFATPAKYDEEKAKEYYKILRLMNTKRDELNSLLNNKNKEEQPEVKKTFVNSFGEATTKEIETSTYKRQQKRQQKEIERFIR